MENFHSSIVQTLSYFDIFEYPLTSEELYRFLWNGEKVITYTEFVIELEKEMSFLSTYIERKNGYYFLKGKEEYIAKRERKVLYTEEKMRIAERAARKIRFLPFVRAMFVCNQLPVGVHPESDIDVFIVVSPGKIWFSRALIAAVLSFFVLRQTNFLFFQKKNKSMKDKICLSFYATDNHLDLSSVQLPNTDIYLAYWLIQLIPVFDPENFYQKIQYENRWVQKYIPHGFKHFHLIERWSVKNTRLAQGWKHVCIFLLQGWLGRKAEGFARAFQRNRLVFDKAKTGTHIIVSDNLLKFHENDRREFFRSEWRKRWEGVS